MSYFSFSIELFKMENKIHMMIYFKLFRVARMDLQWIKVNAYPAILHVKSVILDHIKNAINVKMDSGEFEYLLE